MPKSQNHLLAWNHQFPLPWTYQFTTLLNKPTWAPGVVQQVRLDRALSTLIQRKVSLPTRTGLSACPCRNDYLSVPETGTIPFSSLRAPPHTHESTSQSPTFINTVCSAQEISKLISLIVISVCPSSNLEPLVILPETTPVNRLLCSTKHQMNMGNLQADLWKYAYSNSN